MFAFILSPQGLKDCLKLIFLSKGHLCSCLGFSYANQVAVGANDIFSTLSRIHSMLAGDRPDERLVHMVENLQCCAYGQHGVVIRVSGSFVLGGHFIPTGDGVQVEGLSQDPSLDIASRRMGTFSEQFIMEQGEIIGCFHILKQELYIQQ
eukprot:Gb_15642 [translate_table: standard]